MHTSEEPWNPTPAGFHLSSPTCPHPASSLRPRGASVYLTKSWVWPVTVLTQKFFSSSFPVSPSYSYWPRGNMSLTTHPRDTHWSIYSFKEARGKSPKYAFLNKYLEAIGVPCPSWRCRQRKCVCSRKENREFKRVETGWIQVDFTMMCMSPNSAQPSLLTHLSQKCVMYVQLYHSTCHGWL